MVSDSYRTLLLLRHAKSDYPPDVADHDRPLAPRGMREAGLAGDWMRAHAPAVDAVLCSTATRTRETLERTRIDAPVEFVDRLYDATPGTVIDVINGVRHGSTSMSTPCWSSGTNRRCLPCRWAWPPQTAATTLRPNEFRRSSRRRRLRFCVRAKPGISSTVNGAALVTFHVPR